MAMLNNQRVWFMVGTSSRFRMGAEKNDKDVVFLPHILN